MTSVNLSHDINKQLAGLARRLSNSPDFMISVLTKYQQQERLNDERMAERFGTTPLMLARLALCKRPKTSSAQFGDQIRQIATYVEIDMVLLANIIRQVESLEALTTLPKEDPSIETHTRQVPLSSGLVAAARDRDESADYKSDSSDNDDHTQS